MNTYRKFTTIYENLVQYQQNIDNDHKNKKQEKKRIV